MPASKTVDTPNKVAESAETKLHEAKPGAPVVLNPDQIESVAAGSSAQPGSRGTTTGMHPVEKLT